MSIKKMKVKKTIELEVDGLGDRIKKKRKLSGKTVEYLAGLAGISRQHWHQIENENFRDGLPLETLRRIEEALETNFEVMFNGEITKKAELSEKSEQTNFNLAIA